MPFASNALKGIALALSTECAATSLWTVSLVVGRSNNVQVSVWL